MADVVDVFRILNTQQMTADFYEHSSTQLDNVVSAVEGAVVSFVSVNSPMFTPSTYPTPRPTPGPE